MKNRFDVGLEIIDKVFRKSGIKYRILHGIVLGLVRDKKFLDNEVDIDVGLDREYLSRINEILSLLKENGVYKISECISPSGIEYIGLEYRYENETYWIELEFWHIDNISAWMKFKIQDRWGYMILPRLFWDNIEYIPVGESGLKIPVPCPVEQYLEWEYGADWKIQQPNFYNEQNLFRSTYARRFDLGF